MSLGVTLYRHRLVLLALLAVGALFMLFTRPAPADESDSVVSPVKERVEPMHDNLLQSPLTSAGDIRKDNSEQTKTRGYSSNVVQTAAERKVRNLIGRHRVMVFSKSYCPYSKNAKDLLSQYHNELGLEFGVLEADLEAEPMEVKAALGRVSARLTFPNIFVDGYSIGGSDELSMMHEKGDLALMLQQKRLIV
ncbi:thioredoxin-like protein [Coemansia reversa NRRL 1564]|uniref:Thioredoxin-like protein n=1 Tax=Coemansia reversa (strain ATCC 12441 / NRRL 1564) TaxID=763665 RepID=A0A2G5BIE2_COERN|nr:thioredoxin-like protein [Coemansia reversa NRRL 1564]|eukprot:PIA18742.1 thioredoxin-like protein [Coemansia reversa NRRL 1564]